MLSMMIAAAAAAAIPMTAPGPQGPLEGTLLDAGRRAPVVLIIPGSGPTDRDGNNPLGVTAAPYRLLAEALAAKGRVERPHRQARHVRKQGGRSPIRTTSPSATMRPTPTIGSPRSASGPALKCVWVLGHSEGALVALAAAQQPDGICGVILVSGAGPKAQRRHPRAAARQSGQCAGARSGDGRARPARAAASTST